MSFQSIAATALVFQWIHTILNITTQFENVGYTLPKLKCTHLYAYRSMQHIRVVLLLLLLLLFWCALLLLNFFTFFFF